MTPSERDSLLVEMHGNVQTLLSYVLGNGAPGLVKQVADLQAFRNRVLGALSLLSLAVGGVIAKLFN